MVADVPWWVVGGAVAAVLVLVVVGGWWPWLLLNAKFLGRIRRTKYRKGLKSRARPENFVLSDKARAMKSGL